MKTYRPWAMAVILALPAVVSAADPSSQDYGIEMSDLIEKVAKRTGKQFIIDPRVRGVVPKTGLDLDRVDYGRLLAILTVHQFAAYESNGVVKVVPDANARSLPIPVTAEVPPKALDDDYVTLMVLAKNLCVAQAVPILRPLLPQNAHLAASPQSKMLVVFDRAANARRIVEMLERLDKAAPSGQECAPEMWPPAKSDRK